jgi:hypothetical protein
MNCENAKKTNIFNCMQLTGAGINTASPFSANESAKLLTRDAAPDPNATCSGRIKFKASLKLISFRSGYMKCLAANYSPNRMTHEMNQDDNGRITKLD